MDPERYYKYTDLGTIDNPKGTREVVGNPREAKRQAEDIPSAQVISEEPAALVYSLDQLSIRRPGPVLAAGFGNQLKAVVRAATSMEVQPLYSTGTDDKLRAFSFGNTATVMSLGKKFDDRLFKNEYALLSAAAAAGARTILWAQVAPPSDLLCAEAQGRDILLLVPRQDDKTLMLWELPENSSDAYEKYKARAAKSTDDATLPVTPSANSAYATSGKSADSHADPLGIVWRKCPHCGLFHDDGESEGNGWACPDCEKLYRLTSDERIKITFDEGTFEEWDTSIDQTNPLGFSDYDAILARAHERSGYDEAVRCGRGRICGHEVATAIMESGFIMGSMGSVVGEKITRMIERATAEKLPVIIFCASGGARMQEGLASLMQMAKTASAIEAHDKAGLLYISVLTDPVTGGVTASFATLGDIILAEPGALIGFAGRRVIQDTIKQALPDDFQTAEFALEHGLIDAIVARKEMRATLGQILGMHDPNYVGDTDTVKAAIEAAKTVEEAQESAKDDADDAPGDDGNSKSSDTDSSGIAAVISSVSTKLQGGQANITAPWKDLVKGLSGLADSLGKSIGETISDATLDRALRKQGVADAPYLRPVSGKQSQNRAASALGIAIEDDEYNHAWESVKLARNAHRPTSLYYIASIVDDFIELHGDRTFGDDGAIVAGIGRISGHPVTIIAEEKGSDLKARIARNFGCPQPEGYRKAQRLMKQADKFGRPIVCFVDTQGAFCGKEAEERGMGNAIAESLALMAGLGVPVISIVLGEGGSGGALALAVANRVAMQENAVYSVLSPEGFASILWKDGSRAPEAAAVMKMSAADALDLGIIEDVIPEGQAPAHENPDQAAAAVWLYVTNALEALSDISPEELRKQRYARFRAF